MEGIGDAPVFLEVQAAGDFVFHKIDALGRAQVVELLLVAANWPVTQGKEYLSLRGLFFSKKRKARRFLSTATR